MERNSHPLEVLVVRANSRAVDDTIKLVREAVPTIKQSLQSQGRSKVNSLSSGSFEADIEQLRDYLAEVIRLLDNFS